MTRHSKLPMPLTVESLKGVPDGNLTTELYDYYLDLVAEEHSKWQANGGMIEPQHRAFDRTLPPGLRHILAYEILYGEVLNGGIVQYFYNRTPLEVEEDLKSLHTIGATEAAEALSLAISVYLAKYDWPAGSDERWLMGWDLDDPDLNELPLNESSSERDYQVVERYLRQHLDEVV